MKEYKLTVGENIYTIELHKVGGIYGFELKRNGKLMSAVTSPIENRDDIKLWISEKLLQMALCDVSDFVTRMNLQENITNK